MSCYLRLDVLLGLLLPPPPQSTSSSSAGAATATGRHMFAEGAYDSVMQMANGCNEAKKNFSSSLQWDSCGSLHLPRLAAVWHAIMRARARSYDSYEER